MFFYYINLLSFEKQKQTVLNIQKLNDHEKTFVVLVGMPVPYDRNGNGKNCKGAGYRLVWQGTHRGSVHFCQKYKTGDNHWHWRSFFLGNPRQCQNNHCFFCRYDNSRSCYHSWQSSLRQRARHLTKLLLSLTARKKSLRLPVPSPRSEMRNSWNVLWHPSLQPLKAPHRGHRQLRLAWKWPHSAYPRYRHSKW